MKSLKQSITVIFWALVGTFIVILGEFFIPAFGDLFRGSKLFLLPLAIFSLLGLVLLILVLKEKATRKIEKFLILTGASAAGFFIFVLLHNFVYGLFIHLFGESFWGRIGVGDEPFFFFLAVIVCPVGFLIGAIGSIVLLIKK